MLNINKNNSNKLKKLGIISIVLFAVITTLSLFFFKTCNYDYCNIAFSTTIQFLLIGAGTIGLIYCFVILKKFDDKVENVKDYEKILLDSDHNNDNKKIGD